MERRQSILAIIAATGLSTVVVGSALAAPAKPAAKPAAAPAAPAGNLVNVVDS